MMQKALGLIYYKFTAKEQLSVITMTLSIEKDISWNQAFRINEVKFQELGITTPKGARKCYDRLDERYPEWKEIRDSLK